MLPVVALVGRPNVGKSTLFNALTRSRDALVADMPGVTRDRHYGVCRRRKQAFMVVDTGGLGDKTQSLDTLTTRQVRMAVDESDLLLFIVDAREGLLPTDTSVLQELRRSGKPVLLTVNKVDGLDPDVAVAEFASLGISPVVPITASHGRGIDDLLDELVPRLPEQQETVDFASEGIPIAVLGRPNVGKSTLVNRLLGENRVVVSEIAGTTRDAIHVPLQRDGKSYILIDTAGVRRRARVEQALEKFSVIKTLQALDEAEVALLMLDAREGVTDQDLSLIGYVLDAGRALVVALNKWDGLDRDTRRHCRAGIDRKLEFATWAQVVTLSALQGSGLRELMRAIDSAYAAAHRSLGTPALTRALEQAYAAYQPPLVRGHAPKLRYAHFGGNHPPTIIIHGSRTKHLAPAYVRYLENYFRKRFRLYGTPVRVHFREGENPFAGRKNVLSDRQLRKRKRLLQHVRGRH